MGGLRFFFRSLLTALGSLCRQRAILVLLTVLCVCLPACLAPAAEQLFSRGVSFSGITLGITAPEGDPVPQLLEELLPQMQDISQYCQIKALESHEVEACLAREEVTAVLVLPQDFVQGVLYGENPDVELIVPADRPLESLLTLWVGQSAADLLSSVQSGIYAVLDLYMESPVEGLDYDKVVSQINLRYINWTLSRQDMFRTQEISVTGALPIGLHYGLGLLCFLALALSPVFFRLYAPAYLSSQQRFLTLGRKPAGFCLAAVVAGWLLLFAVFLPATWIAVGGNFSAIALSCALCSLFCAVFAGVCCLVTDSTGSCGILSSMLALLLLTVSGGILPPVMLPQFLRRMAAFSPITWMRSLLAVPAGYELQQNWSYLLIATVLWIPLLLWLYRRRLMQEVGRS